ncbi:PIN domain-like protein [Schizophyllum commune]
MGIDGLWTVLRSASVVRSYAEVFVKEGFAGGRPLRVGVDAEGVMRAAQAVFNKRGHVQHGMNPELWALMCLMCRFARQPAVFVFVFDGPSKVGVKRGTRVFTQPLWLVEYFKQMIDLFGFHHYNAAGEGEVELCHLQKVGALDVIFTEDSDVWVYGAMQVIRRLPSNSSLNELAVYSGARICQKLDLSQPGFLLFALLSGGDYDQRGIQGIGPTVAYALARTSLADSLLQLVSKGRAYYMAHIASWRLDLVEELVTNRSGHLRKRERAVAAKIPKDFPRLDLVWQYVYPTTSVVDTQNYVFEARKLDLHRILRSCQLWFGLQTCAGMYKRCLPIAQAYYVKQVSRHVCLREGSIDVHAAP